MFFSFSFFCDSSSKFNQNTSNNFQSLIHQLLFFFPRTYSTQITERSTQSTQLLTSGNGLERRLGLNDWQLSSETT